MTTDNDGRMRKWAGYRKIVAVLIVVCNKKYNNGLTDDDRIKQRDLEMSGRVVKDCDSLDIRRCNDFQFSRLIVTFHPYRWPAVIKIPSSQLDSCHTSKQGKTFGGFDADKMKRNRTLRTLLPSKLSTNMIMYCRRCLSLVCGLTIQTI